MCGRFSRDKGYNEIQRRFRAENIVGSWDWAYTHPDLNVFPALIGPNPIVIAGNPRSMRLATWGLVPAGAKDQQIGQQLINARAETLPEKPSFKRLIAAGRCVIPATGFYEWKQEGKRKFPYHFRLKDDDLFGFAGLWDRWQRSGDLGGRDVYSFTIITTQPNDLVAKIHNRMPVILRKEEEDRWLAADPGDPKKLLDCLKPYPANEMECYPVTPAVNSPSYREPDCIKPLGP